MAKKHEADNDVKILARGGKARIIEVKKTLRVSNDVVIGIRIWGRIDFLTNDRGWSLVSE